jgi:hypothetical protein
VGELPKRKAPQSSPRQRGGKGAYARNPLLQWRHSAAALTRQMHSGRHVEKWYNTHSTCRP